VYARRFGPTNGASLPADGAETNGANGTKDAATNSSARSGSARRVRQTAAASAAEAEPVEVPAEVSTETTGLPSCPKCGGRMWDNRLSKRNPKAPDYKCRDRSCDGVIWPARPAGAAGSAPATRSDPAPSVDQLDSSPLGLSVDDIPF
jgi:hypothetical protein